MNLIVHCLAPLLACFLGDDPKLLKDYVEPEVGYAHVALPFESVLTRSELSDWIGILDATPEQATAIRLLYDEFVEQRHNPLVHRTAVEYLARSAAASSALQSHGMTSDEFRAAWKRAEQRGRTLIASAAQAELQLIDSIESIEPELASEQIDALAVLRGIASRRAAHAVPSSSRWVKFELRQVWGERTCPGQPEPDRLIIRNQLAEYEHELTDVLCQWSRARQRAAWDMQEYLFNDARESTALDPARIWERSAKLTKQLRDLHLRANEQLLMLVDARLANAMRLAVFTRLYPELYPDTAYERVIAQLTEAIFSAADAEDLRGRIMELRDEFELRYREMSKQLEQVCVDWDDDVATGVGPATSQGLASDLPPYREAREKLCEDFAKRCAEALAAQQRDPRDSSK